MKKVLAILAAAMVAGIASASTVELKALPIEMRAAIGATHFVEFEHSSFGTAATNTAEVFTNTVPAKRAVEFVGMVLGKAFEGLLSPTNHPATSLALKIGDGSDDDLFMTSTELASDGTEVFVKYGPPATYTVASTLTTNNLLAAATTTSVAVAYVSDVTAAATAGELGRKAFNTAGIIRFTFTPNADEATDDMSSGKVRVYFKVFDPATF